MNIEAVLRKHEDTLLSYPNVTGVGIGKRAGHKVIKVMVIRKVPESELQPGQVIPKELDGCELDVEEIGEPAAY